MSELKNKIKQELSPILNSTIPNNWSITLEDDSSFYLYFKFPEITVRGSRSNTHTMYDTYLRLFGTRSATSNKYSFSSLEGTRGKVSLAEYKRGYLFSHMQVDHCSDRANWKTCCLGGSTTAISTAYYSLNHLDLTKEKDKSALETFILLLEPYLSWESLSGVPYVRMDTLLGDEFEEEGPRSILKKLRENEIVLPWRKKIYGNIAVAPYVDPNDPLVIDLIKAEASNLGIVGEDNIFRTNASYTKKLRSYLRIPVDIRSKGIPFSNPFRFKNEIIRRTIMKPSKEEKVIIPDSNDLTVNPVLVQQVTEIINKNSVTAVI